MKSLQFWGTVQFWIYAAALRGLGFWGNFRNPKFSHVATLCHLLRRFTRLSFLNSSGESPASEAIAPMVKAFTGLSEDFLFDDMKSGNLQFHNRDDCVTSRNEGTDTSRRLVLRYENNQKQLITKMLILTRQGGQETMSVSNRRACDKARHGSLSRGGLFIYIV